MEFLMEFLTDPNRVPMSNRRSQVQLIKVKRTINKEVQVEDNKELDFGAVSKFLKNAHEDILFEIFLRFPECRSAISYGSVCRRWRSVISRPQFVPRFIRLHDCTLQLYSIIFSEAGIEYLSQPFLTLFFEDSIVLHGKSTSSGCLDLWSSIIWASSDDLLLLSPDASVDRVYYICNQVTQQWSQIPKYSDFCPFSPCPAGFALVCNKQHQYNVVLIWPPFFYEDHVSFQVRTFCFGSGKWSSRSRFTFPLHNRPHYNGFLDVIACNGILYWREAVDAFDRIIALDVFNSRCDIIDFPNDLVSGWRSSYGKIFIGVACKALRLSQIVKTQKKCFVMKIWELRYKDDSSSSWVLVHETNMTRPGTTGKLVRLSFLPNHSDVVCMMWERSVFQYTITKDEHIKISEIKPFKHPRARIVSVPVVQLPWPTPIPSIPTNLELH